MEISKNIPIVEENRLSCLSGIILRTPDGYIDEVVEYLLRLFGDQDKFLKEIRKALSKYNKNHILACHLEGFQRPALITNFNEIRYGYFSDPYNHRIFQYHHLAKIVVSSTYWKPDDISESWRREIDTAFSDYVRRHFKVGNCCVFGASENGVIVVTACIVERLHNPENFYGSCWRSVWKLIINPGIPQAQLKGSLQVEGYYVEDGSAFVTGHMTLQTEIPLLSESQMTIFRLIETVDDFEETFHRSVLEAYYDISNSTLKAFRRQIPINRARMNWNVRGAKSSDFKLGSSYPENFVFDLT